MNRGSAVWRAGAASTPIFPTQALAAGSFMIDSISAVTLATHDMRRAVQFYRMLGLSCSMRRSGDVTSFRRRDNYLNLIVQAGRAPVVLVGRLDFPRLRRRRAPFAVGRRRCRPDAAPRDAEWGSGSST